MARSLEYKAFRRRYSYLRNTLSACSVAATAFEQGLLSRVEKNAVTHTGYPPEEKNDRLLEAIEKRILADPNAFHRFVRLLESEGSGDIAADLMASYQSVAGPNIRPSHSHNPPGAPPFSITQPPPSIASYQSVAQPVRPSHPHPPPGAQPSRVPQPPPSIGPYGYEVVQAPVQETRYHNPEPQTAVRKTQHGVLASQAPVQETQPFPNIPSQPVVGYSHRSWFRNDGRPGKLEIDGLEVTHLDVTRYLAFPPGESRMQKTIPLSFEDVMIDRGQKVVHSPYSMSCFPHGIAVVINNEKFGEMKDRRGTALDEENLIQTFRYLGYNVEVFRNCTSAQILEVFRKVQRRDHTSYDSFVCCILTHGKEGEVFGSDDKPVVLSEVIKELSPRKCGTLGGKPKLFFIQACRGEIQDPTVWVTTRQSALQVDGEGEKSTFYVPNEADFLFSYACPLGYTAYRDPDSGSCYISELCYALCRSSTYLHLDDMLKDVHRTVTQRYEYARCRQVGEVTHRLQNNVYFF